MVKAVIGEDTRLGFIEDRLSHSAIPAEVGLVIGKLSSVLDRGFVFDLIPTPSNDAGEPACSVLESRDDKRKPSKSKSESSSLSIDSDWVAEHARQVSRMLLGGMKVVGIYVWASDTAFKNSTMILCQVLMSNLLDVIETLMHVDGSKFGNLYQAIKGVSDAIRHLDPSLDEALLIHICYSPRRWNCRTCLLSSSITSSNLRPCDFKLGRVLNSLQRFRCSYSFNFRIPIYCEGVSTAQTYTDILRRELAVHAKELKSANAMVDGDLVHNDEPCNTDSEHEIELLFPFMKDSRAEALTSKNITGILLFGGSIFSYAYLNAKEPVSQAVADIKADIIRSLQSRLDIICDEAEQDLSPTDVGDIEDADEMSKVPISKLIFNSSTKPCHLRLPKRVLVPWLADMYICDYLQPFESLEVVKERCIELMSMEHSSIDASKISEVETETSLLIAESMWDVISPATSASNCRLEGNVERTRGDDESKRTSNASNASNVPMLVGIFVLLLSIVIGFLLYQSD